jgi:hypothetical protein
VYTQPEVVELHGRISGASEGNLLEANNLALNVYDKVFYTPPFSSKPSFRLFLKFAPSSSSITSIATCIELVFQL